MTGRIGGNMATETKAYTDPRPAPLVPDYVDLSGMEYMPLYINQLLNSDQYIRSSPLIFRYSLTIWCQSWRQNPPSSLPNDPKILAHLSGAGRDWTRIQKQVLRGFVLCSDDRLYHPFIADLAMSAWEAREKAQRKQAHTRVRNRIWRASKRGMLNGTDADETPSEASRDAARDASCDAARDAGVTPYKYKLSEVKGSSNSKASARSAVALQADDESDQPDLIDRSDQTALPLDNVMDDETPAKPGPRKKRKTPALVDDSPVVITMPVVGGGEGEYPVTEAACALFRETYPAMDIGQSLRAAKLWLVSNPGKRKTPGGMPRFLANWLQRAQNRGENLLVNTSRSSSRALNGTAPLVRESLSEKNRRAEETFVALMQARAQGEKKS